MAVSLCYPEIRRSKLSARPVQCMLVKTGLKSQGFLVDFTWVILWCGLRRFLPGRPSFCSRRKIVAGSVSERLTTYTISQYGQVRL
jgi:hypothetical protein